MQTINCIRLNVHVTPVIWISILLLKAYNDNLMIIKLKICSKRTHHHDSVHVRSVQTRALPTGVRVRQGQIFTVNASVATVFKCAKNKNLINYLLVNSSYTSCVNILITYKSFRYLIVIVCKFILQSILFIISFTMKNEEQAMSLLHVSPISALAQEISSHLNGNELSKQ